MRYLTEKDVAPAMYGGLLLSAGGSGLTRSLERHDLAANVALGYGNVRFASLDEMPSDGWLLVSTSVGAPGFAKPELVLRDHVNAAKRLIDELGSKPCGIICGHVPGFNAWLVAAALDIPYIDVAANGRGHPTVSMGGLGLASRPDISITQIAQAGFDDTGSKISVSATGNLVKTSSMMRHCASISGGLVASARAPYKVDFTLENGASGAISYQIDLGQAMLNTEKGPERAKAAADFMKGEIIVTGRVIKNTVKYENGFDVGEIVVSDGIKNTKLGVFNEFMTASLDDQRVATFPDMIGSLEAITSDPIAIAQMPEGTEVTIVIAHHKHFPLGKGALDPAVFAEVEDALNTDMFSHIKKIKD